MGQRRLALAVVAALAGAPPGAAIAGTGDLDPTFGTGGIVTTPFPPPGAQAASEILIQPDGRIVVVGVMDGPVNGGGVGVARYLPDGSLDPTFGTGGIASYVTGFDNGVIVPGLLQPDGKIVASTDVVNGPQALFIVRYDGDGALDGSFGGGGTIVLPARRASWTQAAVIHQGRLLMSMTGPGGAELRRFQLADGAPDTGFGTAGVVAPALRAGPLVVQPDDKVLIASGDLTVARVNPDGSPDTGFGTAGVASIVLPPLCPNFVVPAYSTESIALQTDGKVVVLGWSCHGITMVRYLPTGVPDPSFGMGGLVTSRPFDSFEAFDPHFSADLVIEPDGRIVVVGGAGPAFETGLMVARFEPDGALDRTFAAAGRSLTPVLGRAYALAAALDGDGKLVVGGNAAYDYFVVARYDLACPVLPDGDGDGLGDACDPCTGPVLVEAPNLRFSRLAPPAGDDVVRISGRLSIPLAPAIDPGSNGMRLALYDGGGAEVLYAVLDPNAIIPPSHGQPWRANAAGTKFTYQPDLDVLDAPQGIDKVVVRIIPGSSQVKFKVLGRHAAYAVTPGQLPLALLVSLDARRSAAGQCGEVGFAGPDPVCAFSPSGNVLTCR